VATTGKDDARKDPNFITSQTPNSAPLIRVEVMAEDFCRLFSVRDVESVAMDSVRAYLRGKGVSDPRIANSVRGHIERVYGKTVV
jgi:hypothetical protein